MKGYDNEHGNENVWSKINLASLQLSHANVRESLLGSVDLEMNVFYFDQGWVNDLDDHINLVSRSLPG